MRLRSRLALSCMLLAACRFDLPEAAPVDATDATSPDGCTSFSAQLDTCALPNPTPLVLSGALTFDTDTGELKDATNASIAVTSVVVGTQGAEVRAIVATTVNLEPSTILRATGVRGFAIVASEAVTLAANARLDVSGGGAGHRGDCGLTAAGTGQDDTGGGAGGGGGGFGAPGGRGGNGDADQGQSTGGAPGAAAAEATKGPIGGCPGGNGGIGEGSSSGGAGGRGGGAVYLVSASSIAIQIGGGVHAGGGGGGGGGGGVQFGDGGGGGGGSGGSIFLEAPRIRSDGILAANGGGGGEGSGGGVPGASGAPGAFGVSQAPGGNGNMGGTGASGGAGGYLASPTGAQTAQVLNGGGGGGGGGVGFILIRSADAALGPNVSPSPIQAP